MHSFISPLLKYSSKGEKSGWTFVPIPGDIISRLKLKDRKGFRIRGTIDEVRFEKLSTYPVGNGEFIIAINATLRKQLGKKEGATVHVKLEQDLSKPLESEELLKCLNEEPRALDKFNALSSSHRNYHHRYVDSAKGADIKAARIVNVINALHKEMDFGEMIRSLKKSGKKD